MNFAHIIDEHDADSVAIISRNRETTYGSLRDQVARLRGGLVERGVVPGDRVVILCGNNRFFVVSYLATISAGAVAVPLNPASPRPELEREVEVVAPKVAIVGPGAQSKWGAAESSSFNSVDYVVFAEGTTSRDDVLEFEELITGEMGDVVEVEPDDVAVMMFTSGTAGPPKAAMLSHRNLLANLEQHETASDHVRASDIVYGVLPMFHIFGLNVQLGATLRQGGTVLLVQRFDPATAIQSIIDRGITVVPGAPPIWVAFSHFDDLPADSFSTVRLAYSGAARLSPAVIGRLRDRFGLVVREGYGLTEASPVVTTHVGIEVRPGSVGKVLGGVEVRLVGDDGTDVPAGDAGELWVRGDNVFLGYYHDQESTDRVLVDGGWLRTGDIASTDDDGYLYLVDRAKDLIIVSGFNVFPAEVESVLAGHPAVAEVGVLGVPHPHTGEAVKAYAVLEPGANLDEDALIDYAADYLARYKCPSKVLFVDHLPRNASGKLVRRELEGTVLTG